MSKVLEEEKISARGGQHLLTTLGDEEVEILGVLFLRLSAKGLMPVETIRLIKDSFRVILEGGLFSATLVNQKLESMGWEAQMLDEVTYNLILCCIGNRNDYEVIRVPLHYN